MFAGGGTGGHLFPGIALAQEFQRRFPEVETPLGYRLVFIKIGGLVGKGLLHRLKVIALLPRALVQALVLLVRYQPDLVVGLGGYASAPVLVAAGLAGIPLVIQEQNAFPGLANRCLAPFAAAVFTAFEPAEKKLRSRKIINAGNPVRADFPLGVEPAAGDAAAFAILVIGGSLGARSLGLSTRQCPRRWPG